MKRINELRGYEDIEDFYYVTTCGKVLSVKKNMKEIGHKDTFHGKVRVFLKVKSLGTGKAADVHKLVAEAYMPTSSVFKRVEHLNGVKTDNYVGNLKWKCLTKDAKTISPDSMVYLFEKRDILKEQLEAVEKKIQDRLNTLLGKTV